MLGRSAHEDEFCRQNLPPEDGWPELLLDGFDYPERLNAAVELTDAMVAKGLGDSTALIGNGRRRTYKELTDWTNRLAHALVEDLGVKPGNRVLIRSSQQSGHGGLLAGRDKGRCGRRQYHADAASGGTVEIYRQSRDFARALRYAAYGRDDGLRESEPIPENGCRV